MLSIIMGNMYSNICLSAVLICSVFGVFQGCTDTNNELSGTTWIRHTIDASSRGADGIRLADVNGDGLPDIATGWEEGGQVHVSLNPGKSHVEQNWPSVIVGKVGSPEDAVFVDLDNDGGVDVVSSSTGRTKTVWVHWAPKDTRQYLNPEAWKTEAFPSLESKKMWMFSLPMDVDGKNGVDLVLGSKGPNAQIGWLEAPENSRDLNQWRWHPIYEAEWIMSLVAADMDRDGDLDILASDRKPPAQRCLWLQNPGPGSSLTTPWRIHPISIDPKEMMFITLTDLDGDGLRDILAATAGNELIFFQRKQKLTSSWISIPIRLPPEAGSGKAVRVGDIDLDKKLDIVFTSENAENKFGVMWMSYRTEVKDPVWDSHAISGYEGIKYDLLELIDLDDDGDLDVITTEEKKNLGVVWYENPTKK
jgi:hypothetical protein